MSRPLRVLLIEDSDDDALLVLQQLRRGGFEPSYERVETETGIAAALVRPDWDLLISDFSLPQFNGMQALELFRKQGSDIPFILVSGTIGEEIAVEAMRAGAHDYVMKQNLARLVPAVERELAEAVQRQQRRQAEERLAKTEAKQAKMVANIGDVIVIIDQDGINRYKSPNITKGFGWKPEEVVGSSTLDNVHPDDVDKAQELIDDLMSEPNRTGIIECRYLCKDGTYKWIEFIGINLLHDLDIQGILGNYHDITERKQSEQAMHDGEKTLRAFFDSPGQMRGITEVVDGDIVHIADNAVTARVFRRTVEEMRNKRASEMGVPPETIGLWCSHYEKSRRLDHAVDFEYEYGENDARRHLCVTVSHLGKGTFGSRYAYVVQDITERKRGEEALRVKVEELQRWQTATLGREGRVAELKTEVNELAARLGEPPRYGALESRECKETP